MAKDSIGFIINPISGMFSKRRIPRLIDNFLDKEKFHSETVFTQYPGHAQKLAQKFVDRAFKCVVAVGGDGTVNEVASVLRESEVALGIIPSGSGNGMARHLGVPIGTIDAIKLLNRAKVIDIDYCLINEQPFFCTCGVGFDAYISMEFKKASHRGLGVYLKKIISSYSVYKSQKYQIIGREHEEKIRAFDITIANASQWGNNAYIAPQASVRDGKMDVVVLKEMPLLAALDLGFKLLSKRLKNESYMKKWRAKEIVIKAEKSAPAHFDGEPFGMGTEFRIKIVPQGLKVFCADKFQ